MFPGGIVEEGRSWELDDTDVRIGRSVVWDGGLGSRRGCDGRRESRFPTAGEWN